MITDYAFYSLTNFVLGVAVARSANLQIYGLYALLFQLANFCLVMTRAVLGETWLVTENQNGPRRDRNTQVIPTALALLLGLAIVPVFLLLTALLTDVGRSWGLVLAITLALPALLAQDTHRFVHFAEGNPRRALYSDVSWLATQTGLLVCMAADFLPFLPAWAALAWTVGAYVALLTIGGMRHLRPRMVLPALRWWRKHFQVGRHIAVETIGSSMVGPLIAIGLVMMDKELALGILRGASTLFSPILILAQGMRTALIKRTEAQPTGSVMGARMVLMATSLAWGGALLTAPILGRIILGGLWGPQIRQVVLLEAVARVGLASAAIDSSELRKRSATLTAATLSLWSGGLVVTAALLGASVGDFLGAAAGTAAAYGLGGLMWRYFRTRASRPAPLLVR